jgi:hypothetical protein
MLAIAQSQSQRPALVVEQLVDPVAGIGALASAPTWLTAAVTPERICTSLVHHVPEFASGHLALTGCTVRHMRFRERQGEWRGSYLLTIVGLSGAESQVVSLQATLSPTPLADERTRSNGQPFGAAGWHCYLPDLQLALRTQVPDAELTTLPQLVDPEQARLLLETSIRKGGRYRDLHIQACKPKVMRYKPGSRCTVLYQLDYEPQPVGQLGWPTVVVAKTYRPEDGRNTFAAMQALWDSPLRTSRTVTIAEPLAYLPDLNVLVQGPIREEKTLKALIQQTRQAPTATQRQAHEAELHTYLRKTAAGLAELHRCGVRHGEIVTWEDELAELHKRRSQLAVALPTLATLSDALLKRLAGVAATYPASAFGPAHSSFRPAQVLLCGGEIGFIDFDGFCQAEPEMDVALFLTELKDMVLNKSTSDGNEKDEGERLDTESRLARLADAKTLCQRFLAEYECHAPIAHSRLWLWEALYLVSMIMGSWAKLKFDRLENNRFLLEQQMLSAIDEE